MDMELNKKQNRKVTIFAIVLSVISIALLIFGFSLVSSDKVVMLQSISNLSNKLYSVLDDDSLLLDKLANSSDIGLRVNLNVNSEDIDASLVVNYLENKADKKSKLELDIMSDEEGLLGLDLAFADDQIHFFVDDITPRYYHTALEYISFFNSLSQNDYDKTVTLLKESVTDYINDSDIETQKVTISYDGKDKKVNKLTYKITNKVVKDIITNFINSLKKDKSLLANFVSYMNITEEELLNEFDEFVKMLEYDEEETYYYYHVYYYGFNKIVQYELEEVSSHSILQYKVDHTETINVLEDNSIIFTLEITKNKNQYDFNGFMMNDDTKYSFNGTVNNNVLTIILNQDGIDYKMEITSSKQEKENEFSYKNHFILSTIVDNQESQIGTLDIDYEYYFNQKVDVDLTSSVDISEITEEDFEMIQNNVMNHPIYQIIMSLLSNYEISL